MLSGVLLGLFIIPVLFVIFQHLQERISGVPVVVKHSDNAHSHAVVHHEEVNH
jgi:HAE1 family hydrophobic/amphiphilic exporter-1